MQREIHHHSIVFWGAIVVLASAFLYSTASAGVRASATFTPACKSAAGGQLLRDAEFNPDGMSATWQNDPIVDKNGVVRKQANIYIATVNPLNGTINASAAQVVSGTNPAPLEATLNGPEWGCAAGLCSIYFNSYTTDGTNVRLAKLSHTMSGSWQVSFLPSANGKSTAYPTQNVSMSGPVLLNYFNTTGSFATHNFSIFGSFAWRADTNTPTDKIIPNATEGHWVPGTQKLVLKNLITPPSGAPYDQVVLYDTTTGQSSVVADHLEVSGPEVSPGAWLAPEVGGAPLVLMQENTLSGSGQTIVIYKQNADGSWSVYNTITPPDPAFPAFWLPEPVVFKGHSYLTFSAFQGESGTLVTGGSEIWLVSVDPTLPQVVHKVSIDYDANQISVKNDTETLPILAGTKLLVYYVDGGTNTVAPDLKTCDSGL